MEYIATKFSDFGKIVKANGFVGLWECKIVLLGKAIIYDFRKNMLGKPRLQAISRTPESIQDMILVDVNSHHKMVSLRPDKENWQFEIKFLGVKSFPVKFKIVEL